MRISGWFVHVCQYASDLTDAQWQLLEPLLARPDPRGARDKHARRTILNAILYVLKTGCQWEMLPKDFPPHQTVYDHFRRMSRRGVWAKINRLVNETSRQKKGGRPRRATSSSIPKV